MRSYPLRGFTNGQAVVITRGDDALKRVAQAFPRGSTVWEVGILPIEAAQQYTKTHPFDWLHTPPRED